MASHLVLNPLTHCGYQYVTTWRLLCRLSLVARLVCRGRHLLHLFICRRERITLVVYCWPRFLSIFSKMTIFWQFFSYWQLGNFLHFLAIFNVFVQFCTVFFRASSLSTFLIFYFTKKKIIKKKFFNFFIFFFFN